MQEESEGNIRNAIQEELISDLKRVAQLLNKETITTEDYINNGNHSIYAIKTKFGTWNKALEAAGFSVNHSWRIPKENLLENLKIVWHILERQPKYLEMKKPLSKYSRTAYDKTFGNWSKTLLAFQDYPDKHFSLQIILPANNITEEDLFENINSMWKIMERQPKYTDIVKPLSKYSITVYENRFGTWNKALQAFENYPNKDNGFQINLHVVNRKVKLPDNPPAQETNIITQELANEPNEQQTTTN